MTELKKCPFCGSEVLRVLSPYNFGVETLLCSKCGMGITYNYISNPDAPNIKEAWNRRADT